MGTRLDIFIQADRSYVECAPGTPLGSLVLVHASWIPQNSRVVTLLRRIRQVNQLWEGRPLFYQLSKVPMPRGRVAANLAMQVRTESR